MTALTSAGPECYDTADIMRDNYGPYNTIFAAESSERLRNGDGVGRNGEPITTHKVRRKSVILSPKPAPADLLPEVDGATAEKITVGV